MVAVTEAGSCRPACTANPTRARLRLVTPIEVTWPIRTPAMSTSSPTLSPVTSVNVA